MKRVFILLTCFSFICFNTYAQFPDQSASIKIGTGYVQDFPGLGGYGVTGELALAMSEKLQGAFGLKHLNMQGYPRTNQAKEYTKANTLDFTLFYLPLHTETSIIRAGLGYSFSFYTMRRTYPVITTNGTHTQTDWPVSDAKSKTSGLTFIGEYEYLFANSNLSLGARVASYKAYDRVFFVGPFAAIRL